MSHFLRNLAKKTNLGTVGHIIIQNKELFSFMLPFSTLMKLEKKIFFHSLILVKNGEQIFNTGIKDLFISEQIFNTGIKDLFYFDGKK